MMRAARAVRVAAVDGARAVRVYRPKEAMPVRRRLINERRMAWTIVGAPSAGWAERAFGEPDIERLQQAVALTVRLDRPDPVAAWRERLSALGCRLRPSALRRELTSHIAYTAPIPGTDDLSPGELIARGLNEASVHTDLPIGGPEVEVVGLERGGAETPILQGAEWVLA